MALFLRAETLLASVPLMMWECPQNKGQKTTIIQKKRTLPFSCFHFFFSWNFYLLGKQHCLSNLQLLPIYLFRNLCCPQHVHIPLHLVTQLFCLLFKPWLFKVGELTPSPSVTLSLNRTIMCSRKTHCSNLTMRYTVPCLNMQVEILFKITIISPFKFF